MWNAESEKEEWEQPRQTHTCDTRVCLHCFSLVIESFLSERRSRWNSDSEQHCERVSILFLLFPKFSRHKLVMFPE